MINRSVPIFAAAALALSVLATGCATDVPTNKQPQITFQHLPQIPLNVARVDIVDAEQPVGGKHIEQQMPVAPRVALERWARDRLQPIGGNGVARFIITQASVVEQELPTSGGVRGVLTNEPAQRYDGVMEVTLEIVDGSGGNDAVATKVQRQHSVNEKVTLANREQQWFTMVDNMMQDFNRAFEGQIRNNLTKYVAR
jgi:hypothetical protein